MSKPAKPSKTTVKPTKTTKKTSPKKTTRKSSAPTSVHMETLKMSKETTPFLTIAITRQTLYWLIISAMVLALGLWVINIQIKVNELYDSIEISTREAFTIPTQKPVQDTLPEEQESPEE